MAVEKTNAGRYDKRVAVAETVGVLKVEMVETPVEML
jgi:hypothetical protein